MVHLQLLQAAAALCWGWHPSQANQHAAIVEGPLEADEIGAWPIVRLTDQAQREAVH